MSAQCINLKTENIIPPGPVFGCNTLSRYVQLRNQSQARMISEQRYSEVVSICSFVFCRNTFSIQLMKESTNKRQAAKEIG